LFVFHDKEIEMIKELMEQLAQAVAIYAAAVGAYWIFVG
jgi:hypothetical protein